MNIKIFITNLAKYNEGKLIGKWITLPMNEEELQIEIKKVLGNNEELFITDYEADFTIEEYESITKLNVFAEEYDLLDEHDQKKVVYLLENNIVSDYDSALEEYENVTFYSDMSMIEVAEELVDSGCFGEIASSIINYIDYEAIARDISIDGYHEVDNGVFYYQ